MTELSELKVNNMVRCSLERVRRQWCATRVVETLINEDKTILLLEILLNEDKIVWGLIWIQNSKGRNGNFLKFPKAC